MAADNPVSLSDLHLALQAGQMGDHLRMLNSNAESTQRHRDRWNAAEDQIAQSHGALVTGSSDTKDGMQIFLNSPVTINQPSGDATAPVPSPAAPLQAAVKEAAPTVPQVVEKVAQAAPVVASKASKLATAAMVGSMLLGGGGLGVGLTALLKPQPRVEATVVPPASKPGVDVVHGPPTGVTK